MGLYHGINLVKAKYTATANANMGAIGGYYVSPGAKEVFATQSVVNYGVATDVGTITGSIQFSATTVDSDFATPTGGSFAAVAATDVAGYEQIKFLIPATAVNYRYRGVVAGGTPGVAVSATMFLVKRSS